MDREIRRIQNTKQPSMEFVGKPSLNNMLEGQFAVEKKTNSQLAIYRKKFGKLWKSYMSNDGNQIVDKELTADSLKYTSRFTDYRVFIHNFTDDLPATKIYIPWQGAGEQTSSPEPRTSFLAPFDMTCHKLIIKVPEIDSPSTDIVFTIEKIAENDSGQGIATVATFDYDTTVQGNWQDDAVVTINMSDWNAVPKVSTGEIVQIGLNPDNTDIVQDESHFIITSVWKVEIVV